MRARPEVIARAVALNQSGNLKAAKAECLEILRRDPRHAEALHLLGCVHDAMGNTGLGIKMLERAVVADPNAASYAYNLANMLLKQGLHRDAIRHYQQAIRIKSDYAYAHNNLGRALAICGQHADAKASYANAIRCAKTGYADPHHNLGIELKAEGEFEAAVIAFQEALRIQPRFPDALCSLGSAYLQMQRLPEATATFLQAAALQPSNANFQTNVGVALLRMGRQQEAIEWFKRALLINPADAKTGSNLLLAMSYVTDSAEKLHAQSAEWGQRYATPLSVATRSHSNRSEPERRLRIGYVSADFRNHAAAYWIEPLLTGSDHTDFEVFCYNNNPVADETTQRLRIFTDRWIECSGMSDDTLSNHIRLDGIDILVDLSSHTDGNRLLLFARQPAPLQISWFGFPITTGLQSVQYRLTDGIIDPPGVSDQFYSENLVRLDRFYAAYRPDPMAPQVGPAPATKGLGVTFASLNTFAKVTPNMLEVWAEILRDLPNSRLLLQAAGLESGALPESVRQVFARHGVSADRLIFRGWTSFDQYMQLGTEVDIVLDTFPFNGGVTTCHALWMGLPVVSLSGESAASRVGISILTRMGLTDLVARDAHGYQCAALGLASDPERLAALRASMRERMRTGGLLDGADLARQAQLAYRYMWRTWCDDANRAFR